MSIGYSKAQQCGKREPKETKPINKVSKKQAKEHAKRRKERKKIKAVVCQRCGEKPDFRGLQMHHVKHLSQGGKTIKPNLIYICAKCHSELHGIREVE